MNVLLGEDLKSDYLIFQQLLKASEIKNVKLQWSETFTGLLKLLKEQKFDIVFLDLSLDPRSDLSGLISIRKYFPKIPIVIITGLDDINIGVKAIKIGAQDYLVKSQYTAVVLKKTILYAIERNKLLIELQNAKEALNKSKKREVRALIDGQEKERERIAQDLHDGLGQIISLLKLKVTASSSNQIEIETKNYIVKLIDMIIDEFRSASHDLLPPFIEEEGLISSIANMCDRYNEQSDTTISLNVSGKIKSLNQNEELQILRVINELLLNATKHAKPKNINIDFRQKKDILHISVKDDGIGMDLSSTASKTRGIGIKNIRSRVKALNGNVKFVNNVPTGTSVILRIKV